MGVDTNLSLPSQPPSNGARAPVRPNHDPSIIQPSPASNEPSAKPIPVVQVPQIDLEKLRDNLDQLERKLDRKLSFSIDETIDRIVIVVKNEETGEEIRKLPDEATLKVAHSIESLKGLLYEDTI